MENASTAAPRVVAIVERDAEGKLALCDEAHVKSGDTISLVPVFGGVLVIVGSVDEQDSLALEALMTEI